MRVEYRIGYFDRLAFYLTHQFLSPVANGFYIILAMLIFASELRKQPVILSITVAIVIYIIMWIAQAIFLAVYLFTRRSDCVLTHHVVEARDDVLSDSTKFHESRFFWSGIQRIVTRPGFVAVYIAQHAAILIPKRAFRSKHDRKQFIEVVRLRAAAQAHR
jgi:hypothetical protein